MRRYTLKFQIVLLFFLISLPALALSLAASRVNMKEAQEQVVNVKQNSMKMLVKQYDTSLEAIENYIQLILYADNTYSALRLNEKDSRYQQARIWLRDELDNLLKYFPLAAGFYVRIPHNEDIYIVKQLDKIPLDAQEYLEEQLMRKDNFARPDIIEHGKTQYLLKSYSNQFVEIGYILQLNELWEQFSNNVETQDILAVYLPGNGKRINLSDKGYKDNDFSQYTKLEAGFTHVDVRLELYLPKNSMSGRISIRDRFILYCSILMLVLLPIFMLLLRKLFLIPMKGISCAMQEILKGNTEYRIQHFSKTQEFSEIEQAFNSVLNYSKDLKIEAYELKLEKEKEQLINLKLQINPHLLLNSLNTIYSLTMNNKIAEIREFSLNLSKYFRYALRNTSEFVTIQSEIDFINVYSKVQKIRYPNAFYIMFDVDEELMEEMIPPLIIQNFVENSTKYALVPGEEIEILVIIKKNDSTLRISICDSGRGIDEELLEQISQGQIICDSRGRHVGIWNCVKRLRSFYGQDAHFHITSQKGEGTQVWMEFPCHFAGEDGKEMKDESVDNR